MHVYYTHVNSHNSLFTYVYTQDDNILTAHIFFLFNNMADKDNIIYLSVLSVCFYSGRPIVSRLFLACCRLFLAYFKLLILNLSRLFLGLFPDCF